MLSKPPTSPITKIEMIGPIEQTAIRPKLESSSPFGEVIAAIPEPIDITKGTDIAPVVTPPASYAIARRVGFVRYATTDK